MTITHQPDLAVPALFFMQFVLALNFKSFTVVQIKQIYLLFYKT